MRQSKCWLAKLIFLGVSLLTPQLMAKDLTNRLGVGYANQFSEDLPSLAIRYYPNAQLGLTAALGVDTGDDGSGAPSKFGFMVRILKIIFIEDNMNFYMGTGAGLLSREDVTNNETDSGFELTGFAGGEYFFSGLDSLGFSFEAGIGVTSISSDVRFRTIGDHPLRAGIIFYF
ncbi:MAG: organic solvent tolerance protein [Bdellovibrionales bacterium]|nr:organic solvent tolerance protein [Bdellovibrionales bacterium]